MTEIGILANYGILGLWTSSLLYEKFKSHAKFISLLERNTMVLQELKTIIKSRRR